jgi:hypothetical protein
MTPNEGRQKNRGCEAPESSEKIEEGIDDQFA